MTSKAVDGDPGNGAHIKVIGAGGAGGNAVNNMIESNLEGVKFIVCNTDVQALTISKAPIKIQLGAELTQGLGAGANPNVGRDAALENAEDIRQVLEESHMVFITAGLGGGTGTGSAPVIAKIAKDLGALTVAVISKPFSFEGKKRLRQAEDGIIALKEVADTVITIPNDRLRGLASKNATMLEMFKRADEILLHAVKGITDLIIRPGLVNLDFADVRTVMSNGGMALMGTGVGVGDNRAIEAAERAISHPLLEDLSINGARGVLMNITCGSDLTMGEMTEASDRIHEEAGDDAEIIWGAVMDDTIGEELRVTVIATGLGEDSQFIKPRLEVGDYRHKVRDVTPADMASAVNYDEPTFIRSQKGKVTTMPSTGPNLRGYKGVVLDNEDLDVPTFLRKKKA
jgi:cell division protein FtsZ